MALRALIVGEDDEGLRPLEEVVERQGFEAVRARDPDQAREVLADEAPDLAILDLPERESASLFEDLHAGIETSVVLVTEEGSIDSAIEAIQAGVADYLTKPVDVERLERVLAGVKRTASLHKEVGRLRRDLRRLGRFEELVGASPPMQEVFDLVSRVSPTPSTVFLTGETGTGKDVIAETVHRLSDRSERPFVALNCGAVQPSLIESELFGHEPGSFTGAEKKRRGVFEQAHRGTLFLDEITEMSAELQVKLLRVLETRKIQRVGGESSTSVDVRLIAATNRSPEEAVSEGVLREDVFYRLQVFPIHVPPLRERGKDIELLAGFFLECLNEQAGDSKELTHETLEALRRYPWPGNVRELRNVVERAFILAEDEVRPEHVRLGAGASSPQTPSPRTPTPRSTASGTATPNSARGEVTIPVGTSIRDAERELILATLEQQDGDKKSAAKILGISLKTLYSRLKVYEASKVGRS